MENAKTARIRSLNDRLRSCGVGGRILVTQGVLDLGPQLFRKFYQAMQSFDEFSDANDPYDEHDFGAIDLDERRVFWKIDYYDLTLTNGAPDPSDDQTCARVLTIMLAEEY